MKRSEKQNQKDMMSQLDTNELTRVWGGFGAADGSVRFVSESVDPGRTGTFYDEVEIHFCTQVK